jgi:arylsulfatase A-like enzyme/Flp pilus assembly protein TadD
LKFAIFNFQFAISGLVVQPLDKSLEKPVATRRRRLLAISAFGLLAAVVVWAWPPQPPHILLITLDTTRADRLGCYGYAAAKTPVLDQLAAEGALCENACTVVPLTLPAHASLFTGLYPAESGVRTNGRGRLDAQIPTLAESLRQRGYQTAAFVGSFVLDRKFGLDDGFQSYDDRFVADPKAADAINRQRDGRSVVDAALEWLRLRRAGPFFCWVHLYDPHAPYLTHDELFGDEFTDRPYDAEIAYVDRQIGRLIEFLRSSELESRTLVIAVGDHGEGFGEHTERGHGMTLYEDALRVPLIVRQPGRVTPGGHFTARVSLVDLSPTMLELAGFADRRKISGASFARGLLGGNFAPSPSYAATDEPLLSNGWSPLRCWVDGGWKYIRTTRPEVYNLVEDPREEQDLAASCPQKVHEMEAALKAFESRLTIRDESETRLSSAERRALEGLGYLGASRPAPADRPPEDLPDVKDMLAYETAVDEAANLMGAGALDSAIGRLRDVIRAAPRHARAHCLLASALKQTGQLDEGVAVLLDLLAMSPESREGHLGLGLALVERGRTDEALAEFLKAADIDPDYPEAHFNAALILMQSGRTEEALAQLTATLEIDRCHGPAHQWRAFLLEKRGELDEAIAGYQKALEFSPDAPFAHHGLGTVLAERGRTGEALRHLARAVELAPRDADFQYALGSLLVRQGRFREAIEPLRRALEIDPERHDARERLEQAHRATGRE